MDLHVASNADLDARAARDGYVGRFKLTSFDALRLGNDPAYLVKGLVPRVGLTVVWGPPKCGKSFWAFDLAMHVALGWEYRGRRVRQGDAVYCAFEGADGFKARAEAFRRKHGNGHDAPIPFHLLGARADLVKDHAELIRAICAQLDQAPALVVLDTLNRSLGGSESDDKDMTAYVRAADAIRDSFNCAIIIVHHCGVEGTRPRGHTSLTGAADAQLAVKRDTGGNVLVEVEAMKDGPEGETIASRLQSVEVGRDKDGDAITSCIVIPAEITASSTKPARKLPSAAKIAHRALIEALDRYGAPAPASNYTPAKVRLVNEDQWRTVSYQMGISGGEQRAREKAFERARERLVADQIVGTHDGLYWLGRTGEANRCEQTNTL